MIPHNLDPFGIPQHDPGAKLDAGKTMAALLEDFGLALAAVAEICTHGAQKYSENGWEHVPNGEKRYRHAMWRHLLHRKQNPIDEDSGLDADWHFAWNVLASLELKLRRQMGLKPEENKRS